MNSFLDSRYFKVIWKLFLGACFLFLVLKMCSQKYVNSSIKNLLGDKISSLELINYMSLDTDGLYAYSDKLLKFKVDSSIYISFINKYGLKQFADPDSKELCQVLSNKTNKSVYIRSVHDYWRIHTLRTKECEYGHCEWWQLDSINVDKNYLALYQFDCSTEQGSIIRPSMTNENFFYNYEDHLIWGRILVQYHLGYMYVLIIFEH